MLIDVLANDTDADNDTLSIKAGSVTTPTDGTAEIKGGKIEYKSTADFEGGTVTFKYKATDGIDDSNEATVTVTVTKENAPPVADAGDDKTVKEGEWVTLDGSDSTDPEGQITEYKWTTDDLDIELEAIPNPRFVAPGVGKAGRRLKFTLEVVDDKGLSDTDEVVITVENKVDNAPKAVIKAFPGSVKPGDEFTLDASASTDLDGDDTIKAYKWTQKEGDPLLFEILEGNAAVGRFRAPAISSPKEQLTLIVTVTDEDGLSSQAEQVITISADSSLKQPRADAGVDDVAEAGAIVTLDGSKSHDQNEGGSLVSYHWTQLEGPHVEIDADDTVKASFEAPDEIAELIFQLKVVDNDNLFATDTVSVFVGPKGGLQVDAGQDHPYVYEGSTVSLSGVVLNGSGNEQKFRWHQVDSSGVNVILSADNAANVYFVTPSVDGDKTLEFELVAWDSSLGVGLDSVEVPIRDNAISEVPAPFLPIRVATDTEDPVGFDIQSGNLISLKPRAAPRNERATQKNRPRKIPYGLFDFTLRVDKPGDSATLRIWFPEDMSKGFGWYKYDAPNEVWASYDSDKAVFNGHELLLTLTDGGPGDDDGKADGFIHDPGGPGSVIAKEETHIEGSSGGGAFGGIITLLAAGLGLRRRERRAA